MLVCKQVEKALVFILLPEGINLTSPENEGTINYTVAEDLATGHINESVCVIVLTYTGTLDLTITPSVIVFFSKFLFCGKPQTIVDNYAKGNRANNWWRNLTNIFE